LRPLAGRLVLVSLAAAFALQQVAAAEPRRVQQPPRQHHPRAEAGGLAGQHDEHGLRHVLGVVAVAAHLAEGRGVDEVHVPIDQATERGLRPVARIGAEEFEVA
jgi:hypothetical protein